MPPVTITNPDGSVDSSWKGLGKDHLHLNAEGYKIWSDAMEPLLTKLLAGK
jgi:lysophospholipase L1-like esterase